MKKLTNKESNLVAGGCNCISPESLSREQLIERCFSCKSGEMKKQQERSIKNQIETYGQVICDCFFVSRMACGLLSANDLADIDKKLSK